MSRAPGELTYSYDPEPVDFDAEAEQWERFRREGGTVFIDGVRYLAAPATPAPDEPGGWVTRLVPIEEQP